MLAGEGVPLPPKQLASRVFCLDGWGDPLAAFDELGAQTKVALLDLLPNDWTVDGKRVLDFGCGIGRTLRHFLDEARIAEFWGADIDAPSLEWLEANLSPPLNLWRCAPAPPLGLKPQSFDLIWAVSVFTHLTNQSLPWLLELHRMLKPSGLLIATYMGRWNSEYAGGERWNEDEVGMSIVQQHLGWEDGGPSVLMSDWWVRAHWGRAFEILEISPQVHGQTWALMRKRDVVLTTEDLERPADDPREYAALHQSLHQAQRRALNLAIRLSEVERSVRDEYEQSLSWKITSPLRWASSTVRSRRGGKD
jgi:SAM-dependent methyltransferase